MIKIGLAGLPSSGKTTLARRLSSHFVGANVELVTEYARQYINKYGSIENIWEQIRILKKQLAHEEYVSMVDIMITDAPVFMGFAYANSLRKNNSEKETMLMNDLYKMMNIANTPQRYDVVFYLPPLEDTKQDGTRPSLHFDEIWRRDMHDSIISVFKHVFPPKKFIILQSTSFENRLDEVLSTDIMRLRR